MVYKYVNQIHIVCTKCALAITHGFFRNEKTEELKGALSLQGFHSVALRKCDTCEERSLSERVGFVK